MDKRFMPKTTWAWLLTALAWLGVLAMALQPGTPTAQAQESPLSPLPIPVGYKCERIETTTGFVLNCEALPTPTATPTETPTITPMPTETPTPTETPPVLVATPTPIALIGPGAWFWRADRFGAAQEAHVTLASINPDSNEMGLVLLSQNPYHAGDGSLVVQYIPARGVLYTKQRSSLDRWVRIGADVPMQYKDGDVLGARIVDNTLTVYRNGLLVLTRPNIEFLFDASQGGYIGLIGDGMAGGIFSEFGGGNVVIDP